MATNPVAKSSGTWRAGRGVALSDRRTRGFGRIKTPDASEPTRAPFPFCPRVASNPGALVRPQRRAAQGANRAWSFESTSGGAVAPLEPRLQVPGDCRLSLGESRLCWKSRQTCSRSLPEGVFETIWQRIMKINGSSTGWQLSNRSGARISRVGASCSTLNCTSGLIR